MVLQEIGWECVDWINVVQDRSCCVRGNEHWCSAKREEFLVRLGNVFSSSVTRLYGARVF